ncbi:hypothetical protein NPIL_522681 [Nephila pilipes]|uniref:Uncharacterized protein n=1 Tax=Nephila pilipes TaxID=299642 RepID=A0A8X6Q1K9_NEPPI|nr:hypothetical protein NPIL_522681 [Nephila pilipes]
MVSRFSNVKIWSPYTDTNNSEYQPSNEQSPTAKSIPVQQTTTRYGRKDMIIAGHTLYRNSFIQSSSEAMMHTRASFNQSTECSLRCGAEF